MKFEIEINAISQEPAIKLIKLKGEMDNLSSRRLDEEILPMLEEDSAHLIADLSDLNYINTTGIYALMYCFFNAKGKGGFLKLIGINKDVRQSLDIVGATKVIPTYDTLDEALADREAS